ncbi:hypothetical protein [Kutzneria buriramensis]|uniref:alpha-L-rhamnosidase-related protein n=1 Tax=Kutzneria buriramensis TaxID=1045776 RepID=UPI001B87BF63
MWPRWPQPSDRSEAAAATALWPSAFRQAFIDEYIKSDGLMTSGTQTAYAVALRFDLLPGPHVRTRAGNRLAVPDCVHRHSPLTPALSNHGPR